MASAPAPGEDAARPVAGADVLVEGALRQLRDLHRRLERETLRSERRRPFSVKL